MLEILKLIVLIPWTKLEPGMSVFIPCLDRSKHKQTLLLEAQRIGFRVVCKHVVENGIIGLRMWRVE